VLVAETPRDVRLGALASFARRFALVYSYNVNRAVPPRDPIMRLAYRRVRLTIFRTHTGEREVLASAPFMGRPPHRVIHEGVDVALFRPDPQAGRAFRARHGLGDRPFLLAVGALEREKRYDWILDALARLGPRPPPPPHPPPPAIPGSRAPEAAGRTAADRPGRGVQLAGRVAAEGAARRTSCRAGGRPMPRWRRGPRRRRPTPMRSVLLRRGALRVGRSGCAGSSRWCRGPDSPCRHRM